MGFGALRVIFWPTDPPRLAESKRHKCLAQGPICVCSCGSCGLPRFPFVFYQDKSAPKRENYLWKTKTNDSEKVSRLANSSSRRHPLVLPHHRTHASSGTP